MSFGQRPSPPEISCEDATSLANPRREVWRLLKGPLRSPESTPSVTADGRKATINVSRSRERSIRRSRFDEVFVSGLARCDRGGEGSLPEEIAAISATPFSDNTRRSVRGLPESLSPSPPG
jgi:hypothetical protein